MFESELDKIQTHNEIFLLSIKVPSINYGLEKTRKISQVFLRNLLNMKIWDEKNEASNHTSQSAQPSGKFGVSNKWKPFAFGFS